MRFATRRQYLLLPLRWRHRASTSSEQLTASRVRSLLSLLELDDWAVYGRQQRELDPILIKQRYYELAKKMHPDVVALGEREGNRQPWLRFAELTNAFELLVAHAKSAASATQSSSDPAKRQDQTPMLRGTRKKQQQQQQQEAESTSSVFCAAVLNKTLSAEGASTLHAMADDIEAEGEDASLGIDGPQGAFNIWWMSRMMQQQQQQQQQQQPPPPLAAGENRRELVSSGDRRWQRRRRRPMSRI